MELYLYRGEWGLPSIDYECASILTYLKLSNTKVTLNFNGNPFSSPNGMLPYLVNEEGKKFAGYKSIVAYLQSKGFDANAKLDVQDYFAVNGCNQYVFENLFPYFMYTLWGDPKNVDTTRALYAKRIPIPFNFYCPRKYLQKTNDMMISLENFSLEDSVELHDVRNLQLNAKKCINWVSEKLGANSFFHGDVPSESDAVLYGYLSVLLKLTLPNNELQNHLKQCANLVNFVERITRIYFAKEGFTSGTAPKASSSSSNSKPNPEPEKKFYDGTQKDDDTPYDRKKRYILSSIVATVAMVGYAIMAGILALPHDDRGGSGFVSYDDTDDYDD